MATRMGPHSSGRAAPHVAFIGHLLPHKRKKQISAAQNKNDSNMPGDLQPHTHTDSFDDSV